MLLFFPCLLTLLLPVFAEGRILQLYGRGFSFQVMEPEGWTIDTRAAPQIANFIIYPVGQDWRRAEVLIIARFIPRNQEPGLEEFLETSRREFLEACPFGEESEGPGEVLEGVEPFDVRTYDCPGVRREVVATAPFPRYFVVFALTSQQKGGLEAALSDFRLILTSFQWFELPTLRDLPVPDAGQGSQPRN